MTLFAISGAALGFIVAAVIMSPDVSASYALSSTGSQGFSLSDLLSDWGRALLDPAVYTTWMNIDGFFGFLGNETFLGVLSGDTYGSSGRDTFLGTIPNMFLTVCILTADLCIVIAVIGVKKAESSRRIIRKD